MTALESILIQVLIYSVKRSENNISDVFNVLSSLKLDKV